MSLLMTCPGHIPPLQDLKGLPPILHGSREEKLHYRTRLFYSYNNFFSDLNIFYLFVFWTLAYMYFYFFFWWSDLYAKYFNKKL